MLTVTVKKPSSTVWPIAPLLGTHLPNRSGTTAAKVATPMNDAAKTYVPGSEVADELLVHRQAIAVIEPPSHIGVPAQ